MRRYPFENLVFEGGGVKGIAYLGVLEVLESAGILRQIKRVAGTSAGAISACMVSLGLSFGEIKYLMDTLDYKKVPQKNSQNIIPKQIRDRYKTIFNEDYECVYRLITHYGWYSSKYFYEWIKEIIALQFEGSKKAPPYTFSDFKQASLHKGQRPFLDLYVIGTDMTRRSSTIFSAQTTPNMEVAEAVRISMSIPLYFESINLKNYKEAKPHVFSDGGVMRNYPLNLFDSKYFGGTFNKEGVNIETLGARFKPDESSKEIQNLIHYIESLFQALFKVQDELYKTSAKGTSRSIEIDARGIASTDFDIKPNDQKYRRLYRQGKTAAFKYLGSYKNSN